MKIKENFNKGAVIFIVFNIILLFTFCYNKSIEEEKPQPEKNYNSLKKVMEEKKDIIVEVIIIDTSFTLKVENNVSPALLYISNNDGSVAIFKNKR